MAARLVVPQRLARDILTKLHNSPVGGHLGIKKTLEKVRQRFYWVKQREDVVQWCQSCPVCASRKSQPKKYRGPLQPITANRPLEKVAMDILGPLPETEQKKVVVFVERSIAKWEEKDTKTRNYCPKFNVISTRETRRTRAVARQSLNALSNPNS